MSEFCMECWNEIFGENYTERDIIVTKYPELCEGCAEWKQVVVCERRFPILYDIRKRIFSKKKHGRRTR